MVNVPSIYVVLYERWWTDAMYTMVACTYVSISTSFEKGRLRSRMERWPRHYATFPPAPGCRAHLRRFGPEFRVQCLCPFSPSPPGLYGPPVGVRP